MDIFSNYFNYLIFFSNENFYFSIFIYFLFLLIYSSFSFPGMIIFISLTGYIYGLFYGYLISIISLSIGSFIFFLFSKFFLKKFFYYYFKKYSENINNYISKSTIEYLIIFRIIPAFPLIIQNIILSLLDISFVKFIISSIIGFTPIVFLAVYMGNKINNIQKIKNLKITDIITVDFILFILIIILILILKIKFKNKKPS